MLNLTLVSSKELNINNRTAPEWAASRNLVAVVNAGMYLGDHKTNVGFMMNFDFVNNARINSNNTILAFNALSDNVPKIQIIDLKCQNWDSLKDKYHSFTQSIRMIDCFQNNKWSQQNRQWSTVAIAIDNKNNVLFLFSRSPYSVHDFIDILLTLPLNIYNAMYLEGGPEASFYLNYKTYEIKRMGSYETGFWENNDNNDFWPIPNVIGIVKKE